MSMAWIIFMATATVAWLGLWALDRLAPSRWAIRRAILSRLTHSHMTSAILAWERRFIDSNPPIGGPIGDQWLRCGLTTNEAVEALNRMMGPGK